MTVFYHIPTPFIMPKKSLHRIRNWKQYNEALIARGSITVWIGDDAIKGWLYQGAQQQGHPIVFSDGAIETVLTLKAVYRLPLRQTEGFLRSVFRLMRVDLPIPHYSTVSKRTKDLSVDLPIREKECMHIVIDSTGLKIFGEGEWKVRMHGVSKRRTWRKLHLAVDPETGEIEAEELTDGRADDAKQMPSLLAQIGGDIDLVALDGAYDQHSIHALCAELGAQALIPPSKDAKIRKHGNCAGPPLPRDEILRIIRRTSRSSWKRESGYHMRSLVENTMYRQKTIFGASLRSRIMANQRVESRVRCRALNMMTHLGMPESVKIS